MYKYLIQSEKLFNIWIKTNTIGTAGLFAYINYTDIMRHGNPEEYITDPKKICQSIFCILGGSIIGWTNAVTLYIPTFIFTPVIYILVKDGQL
jgi:hypothetical protein